MSHIFLVRGILNWFELKLVLVWLFNIIYLNFEILILRYKRRSISIYSFSLYLLHFRSQFYFFLVYSLYVLYYPLSCEVRVNHQT